MKMNKKTQEKIKKLNKWKTAVKAMYVIRFFETLENAKKKNKKVYYK
jgi:hypothetical protein